MSASRHMVVEAHALIAENEERLADASAPVALVVPAPRVPPGRVWSFDETSPAFYWHPTGGAGVSALGDAVKLLPFRGPERLRALEDAARSVFRVLERVAHPALPAIEPRLFGGSAFDPGRVAREWESFGPGFFSLPRWTYRHLDEGACLQVVIDPGEPADLVAERVAKMLSHLEVGAAAPAPPRLVDALHMPRDAWRARVEAARVAINEERLRKVVLSRESRLVFDRALDASSILERLTRESEGVVVFGVRRGRQTFLGATPEKLVTRDGRRVSSEALAGTLPRGIEDGRDIEQARRLVESRKDREEQRLVVEAIRDALAPLCSALDVPVDPQPRFLRRMIHLSTPIRGRLADDVSVAALAERLHPTPAVGGTPRSAALEFIRAQEQYPRGWYSGFVGYMEPGGDGELAVAIRSALVEGSEARVFAGAGIVPDSDADAEYDETASKQRAILDALGVET